MAVSSLEAAMLLVMRVPDFVNHRLKAIVFVRLVLDHAGCAICLLQAVAALHLVTIADLMVLLLVARVWVVDCIVERVFWMRLKKSKGFFERLGFCMKVGAASER